MHIEPESPNSLEPLDAILAYKLFFLSCQVNLTGVWLKTIQSYPIIQSQSVKVLIAWNWK